MHKKSGAVAQAVRLNKSTSNTHIPFPYDRPDGCVNQMRTLATPYVLSRAAACRATHTTYIQLGVVLNKLAASEASHAWTRRDIPAVARQHPGYSSLDRRDGCDSSSSVTLPRSSGAL
jgi:hypothetical protein